jgi:putative ABC transport system permease protein
MAAESTVPVDLTGVGEPTRLIAGTGSSGLFDVMGVRPSLGRTFRPEDEQPGRNSVVVLTDGLWRRTFGGDRSIIGRLITLNAIPHEVIGVLPARFRFFDPAIELWVPLVLDVTTANARALHQLEVLARLRRGVTVEQAQQELDGIAAGLEARYPETNQGHGVNVVPLAEHLVGPVRRALLTLAAAVGFVLLIACVNVANLLLARAVGRRREMALRAALGAGRARLVRQLLVESVLLGVAGGAAGLLIAGSGIPLIAELLRTGSDVAGLEPLGLDVAVLAFTAGVSIGTGLLFGLLPAFHVTRQTVAHALKTGGRATDGATGRRLRAALVVAEIALAFVLLVGAGLTLRSFARVMNQPPGFDPQRVLTVRFALPRARYREAARVVEFFRQVEQRVAAIPGVEDVGSTSFLPLSGADGRLGLAIEDRPRDPNEPRRAHPRYVTPGYRRAMGLRLVAGRDFAPADRQGTPLVVLVNETAARRHWSGENPIGSRVQIGGTEGWREVVGIVGDVRHWGLDRAVNPEVYVPLAQDPFWSLTLVARTTTDPLDIVSSVGAQVHAIDPDLPIGTPATMEQVVARSMAVRRAPVALLAAFALTALALAAAGLYGVLAHLVTQRTQEIGVRLALGATAGGVRRMVIGEALLQSVVGAAIGSAAAMLLVRLMAALLFEIDPTDPPTFVGAGVLLMTTALAAAYLPARRATKVDPVVALRYE